MIKILFWLYLINAVVLIIHEIDSAYWKEWDLFKLKIGITGFLLLHFPLVFIVIYGLVLLPEGSFVGLIISLMVGFSGLFAFIIHLYFIRRGREEFNTAISLFILFSALVVSLIQIIITFTLII